jgi:predicted ATPase
MAPQPQEPTPAPDVRLLRSITLRNILSFGPDTPPLELRALNVLIGPNGSGKSNLLACLSLLPAMAGDLSAAFRIGGSTLKEWFRKDPTGRLAKASLEVSTEPSQVEYLVHQIEFDEINYQPRIQREIISIYSDDPLKRIKPYKVYFAETPSIMEIEGERQFSFLENHLSVLAQLRDRKSYPEFARLVKSYEGLVFFRDWSFGSISPIREPQRADAPSHFLQDGGSNVALVLNQLRRDPEAKAQIVALLNELYGGIDDFETFVQAGYVELFLREGKQLIPATRLSDGTLRYLCLLAILLHPTPPPLICLEEPELGLHPDAIVAVGKLIKEASTRTQLIVTTHSMLLLDTFQEAPEDVVVVSKENGSTQFQRLDADKLRPYLATESLGNLWNSGQFGGNRW